MEYFNFYVNLEVYKFTIIIDSHNYNELTRSNTMIFLILTAAAFGSCANLKCETERSFDDNGNLELTIYSQKRSNENEIRCEDPTKCKPSKCFSIVAVFF